MIKHVDLGIGISRFVLSAEEKGIRGHFEKKDIRVDIPSDTYYVTSWTVDE